MNNQKRLTYLLICIVTVFAAFAFLHTLIAATAYVPDSGSFGTGNAAYGSARARDSGLAVPGMASTSARGTASSGIEIASSASEDESAGTGSFDPEIASTSIPKASSAKWIPAMSTSLPDDYPVRLLIPSLKIDAAVQYLGVNSKGNLGVPNNFTDVGWYAAGTIPGEIGSAVMDGHVDNGLALAGVFKHLSGIATSSDIYVTDHGGTTVHFTVVGIRHYDYKNAPVDMIFYQHDGSFLKLITCGGTWVPGDRTYDQRVVVTAALVP